MTLRIQIVGGFLGAGKTTLLRAAARFLTARGERVAVITNDQGHALVDTSLCAPEAAVVEEIAGGCFCCRYAELEQALASAERAGATLVLAEAVGSCTDLVATVLAPLDARARGHVSLAPLAIVVDPFRLGEVRLDDPDDDVAYLYRKQIEEADVVLTSRADLDAPDVRARIEAIRPGVQVLAVSGTTGRGVEAWLATRPTALAQPLAIDYARYAAAEARLGWLNARVRVEGAPHAPATFASRVLSALGDAPVAHVKLVSESPPGTHAALVRAGDRPYVSPAAASEPVERSDWLLNARVALAPSALEALMRRALAEAAAPASVTIDALECFQPSPPVPTHRLSLRVVHDASSCTPLAR